MLSWQAVKQRRQPVEQRQLRRQGGFAACAEIRRELLHGGLDGVEQGVCEGLDCSWQLLWGHTAAATTKKSRRQSVTEHRALRAVLDLFLLLKCVCRWECLVESAG